MTADRTDLLRAFQAGLGAGVAQAIDLILAAASEAGWAVFLAGGPVRDLVLGRRSSDLDLATEGDTAVLASRLTAAGYRVVRHAGFGTATLRGDGFSIDIARTRRETYARPGALPRVEPATIEDDLARRDFTVNAMALRLSHPAGQLLDPHGGMLDIEARTIRVLHDRSFEDDATRMLRASRYATRLGFKLDEPTVTLIHRDLRFLDPVSGPRLRRELTAIFRERAAVAATSMAQDLAALSAIHPCLRLTPATAAAWDEALGGEPLASLDHLGLCMITDCASDEEIRSLSRRLHLAGRLEGLLFDLVRLRGASDKLDRPAVAAPEAVETLERFAPAAVWAFGLKAGGRVGDMCQRYLREWRHLRPSLNGHDVERLAGIRGPGVGAALRRLRHARLSGEVKGRREEIALLLREFGGVPGTRA